jgi:REP element-mobilizing transposase RayT
MAIYERRLPHWDIVGEPMFVTFCLHGSFPKNRVFPPGTVASRQAFAAVDRLLDRAREGPFFLRQPAIAQMVVDAILAGERRFRRYELHAYVVMANHVHLLITPAVDIRGWLMPLKGYTGRRANQLLGMHGPFWQDESYDHLARQGEFERIKRYIENNPVTAGAVAEPELFPWSSAARSPRGHAARKRGGGQEWPPHLTSEASSGS